MEEIDLVTPNSESPTHMSSCINESMHETLIMLQAGVSVNRSCDADEGISSDTESPTSSQGIPQEPQDKEERILQLEAEVLKVTSIEEIHQRKY